MFQDVVTEACPIYLHPSPAGRLQDLLLTVTFMAELHVQLGKYTIRNRRYLLMPTVVIAV